MPARTSRLLAGLLLGLTLSTCVASTAAAQDEPVRVGVLRFVGRRSAVVRAQVLRRLRGQARVEPLARLMRRMRQLSTDLGSSAGRAEIMADRELDLLITGSVHGRGASERVTLTAYLPDGTELQSREVPSAGPQGRRDVPAAAAGLLEARAQVVARRERELAEARAAEQRAEEERRAELARQAEAARAAAEAPVPPEPSEPDHAGAPERIRVALSYAGRVRDVSITLPGGRRGYNSGYYHELALNAEAHPFVGSAGVARFFFVGAFFGAGVRMTTQAPGGASVGTSAYRGGVHVGMALGDTPLRASIGFVGERFAFDENTVLPTATYRDLRVNLGANLRHGLLRLRLRGFGGAVMGGGPLRDAFGSDGAGWTLGGRVDVGFHVGAGVSVGLHGGAEVRSLSFGGAASDQSANSGRDRIGAVGAFVAVAR